MGKNKKHPAPLFDALVLQIIIIAFAPVAFGTAFCAFKIYKSPAPIGLPNISGSKLYYLGSDDNFDPESQVYEY